MSSVCMCAHSKVVIITYIANFHNIAVVYYALGNLHPSLRSTLDCIQLVALVPTNIVKKYGIDIILEPFMTDICALEEVCVIMVHSRGMFLCIFYRILVYRL